MFGFPYSYRGIWHVGSVWLTFDKESRKVWCPIKWFRDVAQTWAWDVDVYGY